MRIVDIIARKRDGHALTQDQIHQFIVEVTRGGLPDYQTSALLMAIVLRGMTDEETAWLTESMVNTGERVDLSDIAGVKVGKHSTGGVGDKVSIALAPLAAACGVIMPKMSGRGLGHTGGTLDKLESIPGFRVDLNVQEFKAILRDVGTSIIGQTASLAPADKKLYALRDVTATIDSIPLISASIMSKKLAEGSNIVVLDVKCGDGAFMKSEADARRLAASMVAIGNHAGVRTEAFITDMDAPLGRAVGNSLEVIECVDMLKGHGPDDLTDVVTRFASRVLVLAGVESDVDRARGRVNAAIASGRAVEILGRMIERQGGDRAVVDDYTRLPLAPARDRCVASRAGYVTALKAEPIGRASNLLGAGRSRAGDPIDHAVGVVLHVKPGSRVERGEPLLEIHHRDGQGLDAALRLCHEAVTIGDEAPAPRAKVLGEVR